MARGQKTHKDSPSRALAGSAGVLIAAAIMDARHPHKKFGALMIASHMAVIGVVIALVMIVDNPFSGQASIDSEIIRSALNR